MMLGLFGGNKKQSDTPKENEQATQINTKFAAKKVVPDFTPSLNDIERLPKMSDRHSIEMDEAVPLGNDLFPRRRKRQEMDSAGGVEGEQDQSRNYNKDFNDVDQTDVKFQEAFEDENSSDLHDDDKVDDLQPASKGLASLGFLKLMIGRSLAPKPNRQEEVFMPKDLGVSFDGSNRDPFTIDNHEEDEKGESEIPASRVTESNVTNTEENKRSNTGSILGLGVNKRNNTGVETSPKLAQPQVFPKRFSLVNGSVGKFMLGDILKMKVAKVEEPAPEESPRKTNWRF